MRIAILAGGASLLVGCLLANRAIESELPTVPQKRIVVVGGDKREAPIRPIVADTTLDPHEVALGEELFRDPRLSANSTISCASCHNLAIGGTDGRRVSIGIYGRRGTRNAPTVFNCSLNYRQFWDGRASSLEGQIDGPLYSANEMHSSWSQVEAKLERDQHYVREFRTLYSEGLQAGTIKKSLATYERSLTTPESRFDRYLKGEKSALTRDEQAGYRLFTSAGCISCHQGINIGGNMMQHFGVMDNPYARHANPNDRSSHRQDFLILSDLRDDTPLYKVPSLRNVARTAPYFHDGSARSLRQAVAIMGTSQLGRLLSHEEVGLLVDFLDSLTGTYRGKRI